MGERVLPACTLPPTAVRTVLLPIPPLHMPPLMVHNHLPMHILRSMEVCLELPFSRLSLMALWLFCDKN
jgi:hypothetical protein